MPDAATVKIIESLVTKLAPTLLEPAKGLATTTKDKLKIKFQKGFKAFTQSQVERYSTVKTILSSSTPIELRKVYVNLNLLSGRSSALRDDDLLKRIETMRFVLFTATAGSGKSMLMRYLYLHFLETQQERLPVFINLRDLNGNNDATVFTLIASKIADYIADFSSKQLDYAFRIWKIVLFLDGFDEIDYDKRAAREIEINEIAGRYSKLQMFVSSRPADTFANWALFTVLAVQPLSQKQVELLIDKLEYDSEMKELFKSKLQGGLFLTHNEFLKNPLLVIMMLITLSEFAEIPAKIHLFYERAFDALYAKHDATKEGRFERKRYSNLAIDDFKRLFSYFSMFSYRDMKVDFSETYFRDLIKMSIKAAQIDTKLELFQKDLIESTCMIIKDGLDFVYSHRSFQEYFVAYFISRVKMADFDKFSFILNSRALFDNVLTMLSEMSKEKFEEGWALPKLIELEKRIEGIDAQENPYTFASAIFGENSLNLHISTDSVDVTIIKNSDDSGTDIRAALYRIYDVFDPLNKLANKKRREELKLISEIRRGLTLKDDPRFKELRRDRNNPNDFDQISMVLEKGDDIWLRRTTFGSFMEHEATALVNLRKAVENRVEERRKGMGDILSITLE